MHNGHPTERLSAIWGDLVLGSEVLGAVLVLVFVWPWVRLAKIVRGLA